MIYDNLIILAISLEVFGCDLKSTGYSGDRVSMPSIESNPFNFL